MTTQLNTGTNTLNIEQLKAQVEQMKTANMAKIKEAAEIARLQATIKLESSAELFESKVRLQATAQQTSTLQQLVDECAAIVASMPMHNTKTRTNRVWSGGHRYNYGTQVDLMYQLATGILYACAEHKQLLLAHTGLNTELLSQLVESFGSPSYYSRNYHTIVEAKPANIDKLQAALAVMQSELGVVADTGNVTSDNLELEFLRGEATANANFAQANEAMQEADFAL